MLDHKKLSYLLYVIISASILNVISADNTTEISYLHVISRIQSRFAITLVTSEVKNLDDKAKELFFQAQLPEEAFISNFSMQIKDNVIFGDVKEKEKAKQEYQSAVDRGQSAGLVAEIPRQTNSFQISVNVGAKEKVVFNLTYQEILKRTHGVYKHVINLQPLQHVNDLKVEVFINEQGRIKEVKVPKFGPKVGEKSNIELLNQTENEQVDVKLVANDKISHAHLTYVPKQPANETISGQLAVLYDVERENSGGTIQVMDGYFVHFFSPSGLKKGPKNIVFVLDKSGSMYGRKFEQTKVAMKRILSELDEDDKFDIIMFSDRVEIWKREFVPANSENKQKAKLFVEDTEANGGTDIYEALKQAINQLKQVKTTAFSSMIVFLTDGEPTVGETNGDVIISNTTALNKEYKYALHSLAFGDYADYKLVQRLSQDNQGLARKIYEDADADLQLTGFYAEISSPLLTSVNIEYLNDTVDVSSLVQSGEYNLYEGGEFMVVGKLKEPEIPMNPFFDAQIDAKAFSGQVSYLARSQPITCRGEYQIIEGDILVPCCPFPECPLPRPPKPLQKSLLPASSLGGFIERMWAYQTVKKLLKKYELEPTGKEDVKQKALQLSLKYKFVTSLTSMVVIQPKGDNATEQVELKPAPLKSPSGHYDSAAALHGPPAMHGMPGLMAPRLSIARPVNNYHLSQKAIDIDHDRDADLHMFTTDMSTSHDHKPIVILLDLSPDCSKCLENLAYLNDLKTCLWSRDSSIYLNLNLLDTENGSRVVVVNNTGQVSEISNKIDQFRNDRIDEFINSPNFARILDQLTTDGEHVILYMTGNAQSNLAKSFLQKEKRSKTKIYVIHLTNLATSDEAKAWKDVAKDGSLFYTNRNSFSDLCNAF